MTNNNSHPKSLRKRAMWFGLALLLSSALVYAGREFRVYRGMESEADVELPADYQVPAEFVVGRLMYPGRSRGGFGGGGDWTQGGGSWTVDYPKGDRTFVRLLKRLSLIDVRSVEQPVNPDDGDDIFDWPFLIVGMPGNWDLTDAQAAKIREYLLRGGYLLCDSFFGTTEWAGFEAGLKKIFPDRPVIDLPDDHPMFHTVYDLSERKQVGNFRSMMRNGYGAPYRDDGAISHWRGVVDDEGRVMVAIAFNNDLGDSWQLADEPRYPQEDSNLGIRLGVNYAVYAMTH
ncbi:MAG: DUF4159 domain-containing protein [Steroidobacteraceae bacterium]